MRDDLKAIGDAVIASVKGYVATAVGNLGARIDALEAGLRDVRASVPKAEDMLAGAVSAAVKALPVPQDGKSITIDDVRPVLAGMVEQALAGLPQPRDGKDADPDAVKALAAEQAAAFADCLAKRFAEAEPCG